MIKDTCDSINGPCSCGAWHGPKPSDVVTPDTLSVSTNPGPRTPPRAKKYDKGKAPLVRGFLRKFPDALEAGAVVSQYGATKYQVHITADGWKHLLDAEGRYDDAEGRHSIRDGYDKESGLLHAAHRLWDAAAVLQLMLERGQPLIDPDRGLGPHVDVNKGE